MGFLKRSPTALGYIQKNQIKGAKIPCLPKFQVSECYMCEMGPKPKGENPKNVFLVPLTNRGLLIHFFDFLEA